MDGVELVSGWLTPTVLFCVLNLMIGTIYITSTFRPQKRQGETSDHADVQTSSSPQFVRVPSFLDRVKSINLSRYRSDTPDPVHHETPAEEQPVPEQAEPKDVIEKSHNVTRTKSDSEPAKTKAAPARVLKKSASEKLTVATAAVEDQRRPETTRAGVSGGDEAVDAKADDFINRFRQQLKLQRLDSILRYKEMLNRGAAR